MIYEKNWEDYALLDVSDGNRLERWGKYILIRPDPQAIWSEKHGNFNNLWGKADAIYKRSNSGGGFWDFKKKLPEKWIIKYQNLGLCFEISPMGFKHTGIFPEQAANWNFVHDILVPPTSAAAAAPPSGKGAGGKNAPYEVLNLFAYTGGATVACAKAGANVCHVDAQKNIINMAKRNAELSGLESANIRYIADDCVKFVAREIRRGKKYDAVILDPPSYGRGAGGEMWKIEDDLFELLKMIREILSDNPLFVLVNLYTAGLAPSCAGYMLSLIFKSKFGGSVESDEIGIFTESTKTPFPCGAFSRWVR
ncbi:MAG: class I SAM-dependent methyltransferase [Oscillospiraceae bacterium]|nr:class I SAM-dependent methyltransferase [Oscillospiraceae bacterium]